MSKQLENLRANKNPEQAYENYRSGLINDYVAAIRKNLKTYNAAQTLELIDKLNNNIELDETACKMALNECNAKISKIINDELSNIFHQMLSGQKSARDIRENMHEYENISAIPGLREMACKYCNEWESFPLILMLNYPKVLLSQLKYNIDKYSDRNIIDLLEYMHNCDRIPADIHQPVMDTLTELVKNDPGLFKISNLIIIEKTMCRPLSISYKKPGIGALKLMEIVVSRQKLSKSELSQLELAAELESKYKNILHLYNISKKHFDKKAKIQTKIKQILGLDK